MESELEILRLSIVKKRRLILSITFIIFAIVFMFAFKTYGFDTSLIVISIVALTICAIFYFALSTILTGKDETKFVNKYKNIAVLGALKEVFDVEKYNINSGIKEKTIRDTNMMSLGNIYSSNDYCKGKYKNINFEFSDVYIADEYTDSDGDTHTTVYFTGQWYIFDFNKYFKYPFEICEKSFSYNKKGGLFSSKSLHKVDMEDVEFNNIFRVYAKNDHDLFYVLTPTMMERIKKLNDEVKGSFLFCFVDNKLHIGLNNGSDLFEINIYKKVDIEGTKQKTKDQLSSILKFVEILDLDNDLFKVEGGV